MAGKLPWHSEFYRDYRLAGIHYTYNPFVREPEPSVGEVLGLVNLDSVECIEVVGDHLGSSKRAGYQRTFVLPVAK
ncbi:MAG: hypothetical protein R3C68_14035 [Myxococcota bacterium]